MLNDVITDKNSEYVSVLVHSLEWMQKYDAPANNGKHKSTALVWAVIIPVTSFSFPVHFPPVHYGFKYISVITKVL